LESHEIIPVGDNTNGLQSGLLALSMPHVGIITNMHGFGSCWKAMKLFPLVTTPTGGSRGVGIIPNIHGKL